MQSNKLIKGTTPFYTASSLQQMDRNPLVSYKMSALVTATETVMEIFILEMDGGLPLFPEEGRAISPLFTDEPIDDIDNPLLNGIPQETLELEWDQLFEPPKGQSAGTLAVTQGRESTQTIPLSADMVRTSIRTIPKKEKPKRIRQKCEHAKQPRHCIQCNRCPHGISKYLCVPCDGDYVCIHRLNKYKCQDCTAVRRQQNNT